MMEIFGQIKKVTVKWTLSTTEPAYRNKVFKRDSDTRSINFMRKLHNTFLTAQEMGFVPLNVKLTVTAKQEGDAIKSLVLVTSPHETEVQDDTEKKPVVIVIHGLMKLPQITMIKPGKRYDPK
jgi:hypothetical protein